jgi:hypothetical protein
MAKYEKIAEVEAFMQKFNYFRKPYNERDPTDTTWIRKHGFAGDRIVQDALDGKGDIGLLLNKKTAFICFDIDPKKEEEDAGTGKADGDGDRDEAEGVGNREDLLKTDKADGGSASAEDEGKSTVEPRNAEQEGHDGGDPAKDCPGWKELGVGEDEKWRASWAALAAMPPPPVIQPIVRKKFRRELGAELKAAVGMLVECFNDEPSLVVKSPHGCHVYWCLETAEPSFKVRPRLVKVRREWLGRAKERGIIDIGIEVLPSPRKPLRVPRKDRLIEPGSLEPMKEIKDGDAFWRSLKRYKFEGLIKEEVLNRKAENAKRPGPQPSKYGAIGGTQVEVTLGDTRMGGTGGTNSVKSAEDAGEGAGTGSEVAEAGENARDGADVLSLRPKDRKEAEAMLMPFRRSKTNGQLIKMVEGAKREGLSLEQVSAWILGWEKRSREAGYRGNLFDNRELLRARIATLYATSTATAAGAMRFIELWNNKNKGYARNDEAAARALEALERVRQQPAQSRKAVLRFFADIEAWRRIIDDAVADPTSELDATSRRNRARGMYPLPYELLRAMYSGCDRVWKDVQAAGIVAKAEGSGGQYVPDIGRPQYYYLNI